MPDNFACNSFQRLSHLALTNNFREWNCSHIELIFYTSPNWGEKLHRLKRIYSQFGLWNNLDIMKTLTWRKIDTNRTKKESKRDFRLTSTQRGIWLNDVRDNKARLYTIIKALTISKAIYIIIHLLHYEYQLEHQLIRL